MGNELRRELISSSANAYRRSAPACAAFRLFLENQARLDRQFIRESAAYRSAVDAGATSEAMQWRS